MGFARVENKGSFTSTTAFSATFRSETSHSFYRHSLYTFFLRSQTSVSTPTSTPSFSQTAHQHVTMKSYSAAVALASFVSSVAAHGYISSPKPRMPGNGLKEACGEQVYNNQFSDHFGNVQAALQNMQGSQPNCRMWQCKGIPFSDSAEVFSYTAGQVIPMKVEIRAPHDGHANVSIVKTSSDTVIGSPLISWDEYGLTSVPLSSRPEWLSFDITMPDVSSECTTPGECVIQWFWDAPTINQTYEACIDFTMGGGSGSGTSPAPASSAPPASSTPAATPSPAPAKPATAAAPSTESGGSGSTVPKSFTVDSFVSWLKSSSNVPETFTMDTLISWLKTNAGSDVANKVRRMVALTRPHPRAFQV